MNKSELIDFVSEKANVPKAEAERVLACCFDGITKELCANRNVIWPGFGTFSASLSSARQGRNPQTGKPMQIAASWRAKLKAGKALKDALQERT